MQSRRPAKSVGMDSGRESENSMLPDEDVLDIDEFFTSSFLPIDTGFPCEL